MLIDLVESLEFILEQLESSTIVQARRDQLSYALMLNMVWLEQAASVEGHSEARDDRNLFAHEGMAQLSKDVAELFIQQVRTKLNDGKSIGNHLTNDFWKSFSLSGFESGQKGGRSRSIRTDELPKVFDMLLGICLMGVAESEEYQYNAVRYQLVVAYEYLSKIPTIPSRINLEPVRLLRNSIIHPKKGLPSLKYCIGVLQPVVVALDQYLEEQKIHISIAHPNKEYFNKKIALHQNKVLIARHIISALESVNSFYASFFEKQIPEDSLNLVHAFIVLQQVGIKDSRSKIDIFEHQFEQHSEAQERRFKKLEIEMNVQTAWRNIMESILELHSEIKTRVADRIIEIQGQDVEERDAKIKYILAAYLNLSCQFIKYGVIDQVSGLCLPLYVVSMSNEDLESVGLVSYDKIHDAKPGSMHYFGPTYENETSIRISCPSFSTPSSDEIIHCLDVAYLLGCSLDTINEMIGKVKAVDMNPGGMQVEVRCVFDLLRYIVHLEEADVEKVWNSYLGFYCESRGTEKFPCEKYHDLSRLLYFMMHHRWASVLFKRLLTRIDRNERKYFWQRLIVAMRGMTRNFHLVSELLHWYHKEVSYSAVTTLLYDIWTLSVINFKLLCHAAKHLPWSILVSVPEKTSLMISLLMTPYQVDKGNCDAFIKDTELLIKTLLDNDHRHASHYVASGQSRNICFPRATLRGWGESKEGSSPVFKSFPSGLYPLLQMQFVPEDTGVERQSIMLNGCVKTFLLQVKYMNLLGGGLLFLSEKVDYSLWVAVVEVLQGSAGLGKRVTQVTKGLCRGKDLSKIVMNWGLMPIIVEGIGRNNRDETSYTMFDRLIETLKVKYSLDDDLKNICSKVDMKQKSDCIVQSWLLVLNVIWMMVITSAIWARWDDALGFAALDEDDVSIVISLVKASIMIACKRFDRLGVSIQFESEGDLASYFAGYKNLAKKSNLFFSHPSELAPLLDATKTPGKLRNLSDKVKPLLTTAWFEARVLRPEDASASGVGMSASDSSSIHGDAKLLQEAHMEAWKESLRDDELDSEGVLQFIEEVECIDRVYIAQMCIFRLNPFNDDQRNTSFGKSPASLSVGKIAPG